MQTIGHGNDDTLMIVVSAGVTVIVCVILFGGPMESVAAINNFVVNVARAAMTLARAWL